MYFFDFVKIAPPPAEVIILFPLKDKQPISPIVPDDLFLSLLSTYQNTSSLVLNSRDESMQIFKKKNQQYTRHNKLSASTHEIRNKNISSREEA